jgi:hypothetical protein
MVNSKERSDIQTKVKTDELFIKRSARNVPLTKADLRKTRAALRRKNSVSSNEGTSRK